MEIAAAFSTFVSTLIYFGAYILPLAKFYYERDDIRELFFSLIRRVNSSGSAGRSYGIGSLFLGIQGKTARFRCGCARRNDYCTLLRSLPFYRSCILLSRIYCWFACGDSARFCDVGQFLPLDVENYFYLRCRYMFSSIKKGGSHEKGVKKAGKKAGQASICAILSFFARPSISILGVVA